MKKYDYIIIGSGSGLMVLEAALSYGKKCALIESSKLGGTCLTKGCIPSKMLVYPADLIRETQDSSQIGLSYSKPQVDWDLISKRVWEQIDYNKNIEESLKRTSNVDLYKGYGEFIDDHTLRVKYADGSYSEELIGENIVISVGARTNIPPIEGLEQAAYVTAESFFGPKYPKKIYNRLAILGAGAIGTEFAHIFSALGSKVTLIEALPRILSLEEPEVSQVVENQLTQDGIDIKKASLAKKVTLNGDTKVLHLEKSDGSTELVECDEIFIATGVKSNGDLLKIENTSLDINMKNYIITNEQMETNVEHIYAIGDINGKFQFRHTANKEAEILVHNLFIDSKNKKSVNYHAVPWAVFTHPQVAHVGMTEEEVKNCTDSYKVGYNHYSDIVAGISMGFSEESDVNGFVKLIVGPNKSILGASIVGPNASVLIQPYVYLMNCNQKCDQKPRRKQKVEFDSARMMCPHLGTYTPMDDSMVIHPAMSELTAWVTESLE